MAAVTTHTPPVSAKSARETIAEAVNVMAAATAWNWSNRTLEEVASAGFVSEPRPSELRLHAHAEAKAALALRALLDAPPGSVGRLHRALDVWTEQYGARKGDVTAISRDAHLEIGNAWAALRASPEAVGVGASACEMCKGLALVVEMQTFNADKLRAERDAIKDERDAAKKERDALFATRESDRRLLKMCDEDRERLVAEFAAAQHEITILRADRDRADQARRDTEARIEEWKRQTVYQNGYREGLNERDAYHNADKAGLERERDSLRADLAAARGEVERMRAEIAGDSHTCANGTVRPYPSVVCSLCVSRGITPPPATEAPISERAGAVLVSTVRIYLGDGGVWRIEDAGPLKCEPAWGIDDASICVRLPGRVAAAAERAAKGGAWS